MNSLLKLLIKIKTKNIDEYIIKRKFYEDARNTCKNKYNWAYFQAYLNSVDKNIKRTKNLINNFN
jgi:hypothetical protein